LRQRPHARVRPREANGAELLGRQAGADRQRRDGPRQGHPPRPGV